MDRRAFTLSASDASWASGAFCEPFTLYGWIGLDFSLSTHGKACWIPSQLCLLSSDDSLCCTSSRYECEVVLFSELQGTGAQWDHTVWAGRSPRANHLEPTTLLRQLSKSQLKNAIIEFVNSKAYNENLHEAQLQTFNTIGIWRLSQSIFELWKVPQSFTTIVIWKSSIRNYNSRCQFLTCASCIRKCQTPSLHMWIEGCCKFITWFKGKPICLRTILKSQTQNILSAAAISFFLRPIQTEEQIADDNS